MIFILICLHVGNFKPQNYLLQRNHYKSIKAKSRHISYILFSGTGIIFGSLTLHPMWKKNIQHFYEVDVVRFLMISDECHN